MLSMHESIRIAKAYLLDVYADSPPRDLRLEEIERSEDGRDWIITLGYQSFDFDPSDARLRTHTLLSTSLRVPRDLKVLRVNATNGEVYSMKNRAA